MATPPPPDNRSRSRHVTTSPCPCSSVPESTTTTKSTELVWKDIKLASLCDGLSSSSSSSSTTNSSRSSSVRNMLLHDFLAGPFTKHSSALVFTAESAQPTTLNFSSTCAFHKQSRNSFLSSFDALKKTPTICPSSSQKRVHQDVCSLSDRRHQRMIKNRESALRSRARKQAYRNALEIKLARLTEENSRLRRQVEEFKLFLTSSAKHPKMRTLYRTSTSPF